MNDEDSCAWEKSSDRINMRALEEISALNEDLQKGGFFKCLKANFVGIGLADKIKILEYVSQFNFNTNVDYRMMALQWLEDNNYEKLPFKRLFLNQSLFVNSS